MKTRILSFFIIAFFIAGCNGQPKGVSTLSAKEFSEKLKTTPNAQLLDVRTPQEFSGEHIDNAANADWNGDDFESKIASYDKSKPVFVYCKAGGRSASAAEKLHEIGFTEVYDLQGGMLKWNAAGFSKPSTGGISVAEYDMKTKSGKVLVNFYADWCTPCKKMKPFMEVMQQESTNVKILRIEADANKALLSNLKITDLPVLYLYENGKITWQHTGFISEDDLKKQIQ